MLALHRALKNEGHELVALLNMCDQDSGYSRSHGLKQHLLQRQAEAMGMLLVQQGTTRKEYAKNFKVAVNQLKEKGVEAGVFGDIYLEEHRVWIERVCSEIDIQPIFPLWGNDTKDLALELIDVGFKPVIVSVREGFPGKELLGRIYDHSFIDEIQKIEEIDICAENGEFHSFVVDGPLFQKPVSYETGEVYFEDKHWFLELN